MAKRKTNRRIARGYYRMTPKRKAALKKAQLVSAKKRSLNKKKVVAGITAAAVIGGVVARHKLSGSEFSVKLSRMNAKPQLRRDAGNTRPIGSLRTYSDTERFGSRFDALAPSAPAVTNRVIIAEAGVRNLFGVTVNYRQRPLTRRNISVVRGRRTSGPITPNLSRRPKVDIDQIPLYKPQGYTVNGVRVTNILDYPSAIYVEAKGGSRQFPSMGAEAARRQNRWLRKQGEIR